MISKWLAKLYYRWNGKPELNIDEPEKIDDQMKEAWSTLRDVRNTSQEFKDTVLANHFSRHLIYSKGETEAHGRD